MKIGYTCDALFEVKGRAFAAEMDPQASLWPRPPWNGQSIPGGLEWNLA